MLFTCQHLTMEQLCFSCICRRRAMPIEKYRSYHGGEVYLEYQDRTIKVMKAELK